jgi:hypothetical protein
LNLLYDFCYDDIGQLNKPEQSEGYKTGKNLAEQDSWAG